MSIPFDTDIDYGASGCNMQVNQAFFFQGDGMHNSAALLLPLLNDGVKLLVYAGNADAMCNYMVRAILLTVLSSSINLFL